MLKELFLDQGPEIIAIRSLRVETSIIFTEGRLRSIKKKQNLVCDCFNFFSEIFTSYNILTIRYRFSQRAPKSRYNR